MIKKEKKFFYLFTIIIINLIIKIIFLSNINIDILNFSDQTKYIRISQHLFDNGFFEPNNTFKHRTPFYPYFLYFLRNIFDNLYFIVIIQNLFNSLSILITYNLAKLVYKKNAILITLIFSLNLNIVLHTNLILTESIFIPFFIIFLYFSIKFFKKERLKDLILASIILGICTLIRPQTYYFPSVIFLMIFIFLNKSLFEKFKFFIIFFVIFKCFTFAWETRNYIVHDKFFFETSKKTNLIGYYLPHFDQYQYGLSLDEAKKRRNNKWKTYLKKNNLEKENFVRIDSIAVKYSINEILSYNLSSIFKAMIYGITKNIFTPTFLDMTYWFNWEKTSFSATKGNSFLEQSKNFLLENNENNFFIFFIVTFCVLLVSRMLEFYGFLSYFKKDVMLSIYFLLIISYFLILIGPIGHAKYRIPFEFIFSVYLSITIKKILIFGERFFKK